MPHAIRFHKTGGPEVLQWEDVPVGEPGPGEARVAHKAIGLNFIETYHRSGLYPLPLPSGLGTEAANWYLTRRTMQGAADTAASAAATALAAGTTNPAVLASEAKSIAAYYNFVGGSNGTTVTVNYPPKSGTHQTNAAVEAEISKQETPLLSSLFLRQGPTISVRAVALVNSSLTAIDSRAARGKLYRLSKSGSHSSARTLISWKLFDAAWAGSIRRSVAKLHSE